MATYTITINERTKEGRGLLYYLQSLGVLKSASEGKEISEAMHKKIDKAIEDVKNGKYKRFASYAQFEKYMDNA